MKIAPVAATAASFALTLTVSIACIHASAQQVATQSGAYQAPPAVSASMAEAPSAPELTAASCGSIGPQGEDTMQNPSSHWSNDSMTGGTFDASAFLRGPDLAQMRDKLTQTATVFIQSLQKAVRSDSPAVAAPKSIIAVPNGYILSPKPVTMVSPVVLN
ncbi:MAG TPA: hypothetical protein V6C89_13710 [Drouetiella sp.]|jgi:hypothetical protein